MTLQLLHSEFPYIWGKFDFIFFQCTHPPVSELFHLKLWYIVCFYYRRSLTLHQIRCLWESSKCATFCTFSLRFARQISTFSKFQLRQVFICNFLLSYHLECRCYIYSTYCTALLTILYILVGTRLNAYHRNFHKIC